jgi:DMATS type aromatic prenyltransferase
MLRRLPGNDASSLGDFGVQRLQRLAQPAGLRDQLPLMESVFRLLLDAWSPSALGEPAWPSDVCDDHSPFEYSIVIGGATPELRLLVESRGDPPTLASNQEWGLAVNQRLAREYGVRLERFNRISDLFLPVGGDAVFALWHAVSFWPGRAPEFKCYLNVNARGPSEAPRLVQEALTRLGFGHLWPAIAASALRRSDFDRLAYFSLDLSPSAAPRVKIYFRHLNSTAEDLELACSCARDYSPGRIAEFCRALSGGEERFSRRGPVSCLSLVDANQPSASTIYFPIASYAPNDRVARNRIASYLVLHELPLAGYLDPLQAFATRRLEDGIGMQTYASMKWGGDKPRVTTYFSPEAFHVQPPRPLLRNADQASTQ